MKALTVAAWVAASTLTATAFGSMALAQDAANPAAPPPAAAAAPAAGKNLQKLEGERQTATWEGMTPAQIEGKSIYNDVGAFLGKVEDVLGDDEFQIAAVTVEVGGLLGIGGEKVVVPIAQVRPHKEPDALLTDLAKSDLEGMEKWNGE